MNIEGGAIHQVPTVVRTPRTVVAWQFSSQPRGIAVGLSYKDLAGEQEPVDILPLRRVMSHKTLLTGEYVAQKAGIYIVTFSNAHSKYGNFVCVCVLSHPNCLSIYLPTAIQVLRKVAELQGVEKTACLNSQLYVCV